MPIIPHHALAALVLLAALPGLAGQIDMVTRESEYDGGFNAEEPEYYTEVAFSGLAGGIIAALCALGTLIFVIVRCGCMCCNGKTCCPAPNPAPRSHKILLKVVIGVVSVGAVVGAVITIVGAVAMTSAVRDLKDETLIERGINALLNLLDDLEALANQALEVAGELQPGGTRGGDMDLGGIQGTVGDVRSEVDTIVDFVKGDVDKYVEQALTGINALAISVGVLVMVPVLVGLLGAILGRRSPMICAMTAVPVWLVLAWLLFGIMTVLHALLGDVCNDIQGTVRYCQAPVLPGCADYYVGSTLNEQLAELDTNGAALELTQGINQLIGDGNAALEEAYRSTCDVMDQLNGIQAGIVNKPPFCFEQGELLCLPFQAEAAVEDVACGTDIASRYSRLEDFDTGFASLHCSAVDDTVAASQAFVQNAQAGGSIDFSDPVLACLQDGRIVGNTLFQDLSGKAAVAGDFLGSFDVILNLLKLQPLWNVLDSLATSDCPTAIDAAYLLYVAFCVLGVFLVLCAIGWLTGIVKLPNEGVQDEQWNNGSPGKGPKGAPAGAVTTTQPALPVAGPNRNYGP